MDNIQSEYQRVGNALGVQGKINAWQMFVLSPIIAPMIIFWGIVDLFFGTIPDMILGISYDSYSSKEEAEQSGYEWAIRQREQRRIEEAADHEAFKQYLFESFDKTTQ
jgi:hypothetical protein